MYVISKFLQHGFGLNSSRPNMVRRKIVHQRENFVQFILRSLGAISDGGNGSTEAVSIQYIDRMAASSGQPQS